MAFLGDDVLLRWGWWKMATSHYSRLHSFHWPYLCTRVTPPVSMISCEEYYHLRSLADLSTPQLFAKHLFGDTRCVFKSFSACPKLLNTFLPLSAGNLLSSLTECTLYAMWINIVFINFPRLVTDNRHEHEGSMMSKTLA